MKRSLLVPLSMFGGLFVLVVAALPANAHPPEAPVEPVPDPSLRSLFIVAAPKEWTANQTSSGAYCCGPYQQAGLGMSLDPNATETPSKTYTLTTGTMSYVCVPYRPCSPPPVLGEVAFMGEDFRLVPEEAYEGFLHLTYSFRSNFPQGMIGASDLVGSIDVDLVYDGESYNGASMPLKRSGGELHMPLAFARGPCYDEEYNEVPCANMTEAHPEVWTHDAVLKFAIHGGYSGIWDQTFGSSLIVKLDTAGGSWLTVRELVPPPPEPDLAEAADAADLQPIEAVVEDMDGDGEPDQLALAPGPSPVLILAGAALAVGVARRWLLR